MKYGTLNCSNEDGILVVTLHRPEQLNAFTVEMAEELVAYSADIFDAVEAQRGGLVKAVYPADQLLDEAHRLAHRITDQRSSVAVALTRQMFYRNAALPHPLEAHRIDSLAMFYTSIGDGKEGVAAFLEKRPAEFKAQVTRDMPPFYRDWKC